MPPDLTGLGFDHCENPTVSIVIPTYGNLQLVLRCLKSIQDHLPRVAHEIIVVEDGSGDSEMHLLCDVPGIRHHANPANLGFLRTCNAAADLARAEFIFFLNNDTCVTEGWLDEALDVFGRFGDCGLVGSKLLFPDGRLQEAGAIVWSDASAWNFGRGADPAVPEFNYVRQVDYCSGAAILVKAKVFRDAGGFDERYAPAYYEDADLAFRLRQKGLKTYYCPRSAVYHDEGRTHGTDPSQGVKAFQLSNRHVFRRRWRAALERKHYRNGQRVFRAREHGRNRDILLFMDHTLPRPDRDAGSRAILQNMLQLARMGFVVKFWPDDQRYEPGLARTMEESGIEILIGPAGENSFQTFLSENGEEIDFAILCRPNFAPDYVAALRRSSAARIVYFGHDLHSLRMHAQAELTGDPQVRQEAEEMFRAEKTLWQRVDSVIYPSLQEAEIASRHVDARKVHVVPLYTFNDRELSFKRDPANPDMMMFVACFGHPPNEDAAEWLANSILPVIRQQRPDMVLHLVGSLPTDRVLALAGPHVRVTGQVSAKALDDYYRAASVVVAPVRFGGGVKLKVVEAMARGVPLVTTSVGIQGLEDAATCIEVADDEHALAQSVIGLLSDPEKARANAIAAIDYVRSHYSEDAMQAALWRALVSHMELRR